MKILANSFLLLLFFVPLLSSQAQSQQTTIDSLTRVIKKQQTAQQQLTQNNRFLKKKLDQSQDRKDSVQKLLNFARYREGRYRTELRSLKKLLEKVESNLDSLQRAYNEIFSLGGSTLADYRKHIESLTTQRNSLASQNQVLQAKLNRLEKADNHTVALFVLEIRVIPSVFHQNRVHATYEARNANQLQVQFKLSRSPAFNDKIVVKLFDGFNQEIPLSKNYQKQLIIHRFANQKLVVEPDTDTKQKFTRGNYSIRLFLTNPQQGIQNQAIGIAEFSLR